MIKNIIAIASGKGGVGKSTVAVNLATALSLEHKKIGLLDADIYGPSVPLMMGITDKPTGEPQRVNPVMKNNIETMSMAYFVDVDKPAIWRGPMVSMALQQLFNDTVWGDLDYLIIDLPPGTGDVQLTLSQKIPVTGVVIVTTPQEVAVSDARKALKMFQKVNVPILGVVENMSLHRCSQCGHEDAIFGSGGAKAMSEKYHTELLGQLPLDKNIREAMDRGQPSQVVAHYQELAKKIIQKIDKQNLLQSKMPKVVIKDK
ncbi:MAG: iron-sulfur cluster carrier protein ApbC [Gammaproteobacteria bacterium]|nr:iron-sulfur cluster carrier protein ApbC [Gammaproteobacteria bacterium]